MEKIYNFVFGKKEDKPKTGDLKNYLNITFKDELVNFKYNNVGTYKAGSRTTLIKK